LTTTLAETVAWSTGAAWPVDGEAATIGSIAAQVQELKDRSNFLKSKTNQLGYQILEVNPAIVGGTLDTGTLTSTSPVDVTNGTFTTSLSCSIADIVTVNLGPLLVKNLATDVSVLAYIDFLFLDNVLIPANVAYPISVSINHYVAAAGYCKFKLQITANASGASIAALEKSHNYIGTYQVLRPVT
jgi:hypothetical protein